MIGMHQAYNARTGLEAMHERASASPAHPSPPTPLHPTRRRVAIAADSVFFLAGPLIMALAPLGLL